MLNELTEEQKVQLEAKKEEWLAKIFKYKIKIDPEAIKTQMKWLYNFCELKKVPEVIVFESPLAVTYATNMLQFWFEKNQINTKDRAKPINENVLNHTIEMMRPIADAKGISAKDFEAAVKYLRTKEFNSFSFSVYGNVFDYGWASFIDFFKEIGIVNDVNVDEFFKLLDAGIYDSVQLEDWCLVCTLPYKINHDEQFRLHSETDAAIAWKDGYELYFWHGMNVTKKLVMTPDEITREEILKETNAEVRRAMQAIMGDKRFATKMDIKEVERDKDSRGNDMVLYRTKERDNVVNDYIWFANVIDPSTGREYYLCIPPEVGERGIWAAVAWTFNEEDAANYRPEIET